MTEEANKETRQPARRRGGKKAEAEATDTPVNLPAEAEATDTPVNLPAEAASEPLTLEQMQDELHTTRTRLLEFEQKFHTTIALHNSRIEELEAHLLNARAQSTRVKSKPIQPRWTPATIGVLLLVLVLVLVAGLLLFVFGS